MDFTALIILTYNNSNDTLNCINSICQYNTAPIKIIVVDNNSRSTEIEELKAGLTGIFGDEFQYYSNPERVPALLPEVSLIETGENLGYAKGNNVGLTAAYSDNDIKYTMILNNDILFVSDIIPSLTEKLNKINNCAVISPVLYKAGLKEYDYDCARRNMPVGALIHRNIMSYWWRLRNKGMNDVYRELYILKNTTQQNGCIEIELPSGSCMLLNKEYFKSIGWFDPNTFLFYEENILYSKIVQTGHKNYLSLDDKCIHLGASTMKSMNRSKFVVKQGKVSEQYYVDKYSKASRLTKVVHRLSVALYMAMFNLQKLITTANK